VEDLQLSIKVSPDAYELDTGFIPVVRKVKVKAGPADTNTTATNSEKTIPVEKKIVGKAEPKVVKSNGQAKAKR
jgi:hypothetical protein